jgi:UDP-GlcNAc:undecaprenyl-phosphate GlcNAc-1-phosphate transferase
MMNLWLAPTLAAVIALALVPIVRSWAHRIGAVDHPGELSTHDRPSARLGGVAVWSAAMLALLVAGLVSPIDGNLSAAWVVMAVSATAVLLLGLADDLRRMSPWPKLIAAVVVAFVAVSFGWSVGLVASAPANIILSTFWIVFLMNAFNALDGLDGLAAGVALLSLLFLGLWFVAAEDFLSAAVSLALAGALAGFLVYNFPPSRRIFLGDCGSLFLGFVLAALVMRAVGHEPARTENTAWVPFTFVSVPLIDAVVTFARRILSGKSPLRGDRSHVYDELYRRTGSMRVVATTYYLITLAASLAAWLAA